MSENSNSGREVEAGADDAGMRLDSFLAARLPDLSRARLQALLRDGHVRCGADVVAEASSRVKAGQRYRVIVPPVAPAKPQGEAVPLHILHEDDHLIVVVKPAGMVVHPAPGHSSGTLVNALIGHCGASLSGIGGVARPGIVHRLDRDVSGVMVAAKTDAAHRGLAGQFTVHSIERVYDALVWGLPTLQQGSVEEISLGTRATASAWPSSNATGNGRARISRCWKQRGRWLRISVASSKPAAHTRYAFTSAISAMR